MTLTGYMERLVRDRNDILFFPSILHSGTHFLRWFLQSHPKIRVPWVRLLIRGGGRLQALPPPTGNGERLLLHIHPFFADASLEEAEFLLSRYPKAATSFRNPLGCAVTHYSRWGEDPTRRDFPALFKEMNWVAEHKDDLFVLPVDLYEDPETRRDTCNRMLDHIGLEMTPQMAKYVAKWPVQNKQAVGSYREQYEKGEIDEILSTWWGKEFLAACKPVQEFAVSLGYAPADVGLR